MLFPKLYFSPHKYKKSAKNQKQFIMANSLGVWVNTSFLPLLKSHTTFGWREKNIFIK